VTAVHADLDALAELRAALTQFRYAQREVADRGADAIEATRASLEAKAARWRARLEQAGAELAACRDRSSPEDPVDCSGYARAAGEAGERLEHIRRWQQRIDQQATEFRVAAGRFAGLLETDLPRAEEQLAAVIARLKAARRVQSPGA
jgi:hypothetical protein